MVFTEIWTNSPVEQKVFMYILSELLESHNKHSMWTFKFTQIGFLTYFWLA